MSWDALEKAGGDLVRRLGPSALRTVADHARQAWPREAILRAMPGTETVLDALTGVDRPAGLAYLTGLAAGYSQRAAEVSVDTVWSGPGSHHVPVRATAVVLADVVREARRELLLMTYSAQPYQPLSDALGAALSRGVVVSVVVETPSPTATSCWSPAPTSPSPASPRTSKPAFSSAAERHPYAPPSTSTPSAPAALSPA